MSTKINLWFVRFPNPELESKLPEKLESIRLFCGIRFKTKMGWYDMVDAIVDTGAPISVIPLDIWDELDVRLFTEHEIHGLNLRKDCAIPVKVGKVRGILADVDGNATEEIEFWSYLAPNNQVPLLLGFKDLLERFKVSFNLRTREAFLSE